MEDLIKEKTALEDKIYNHYKEHLVFDSNNSNETLRQHSCRITKDAAIKTYIIKIHECYLPAYKSLLKELREHNDLNKKIMNVAQEELDILDEQHNDIVERIQKT